METNAIKQAIIRQLKEVLYTNNKIYYASSDFPFVQTTGRYSNYQENVMNKFLQDKGFMKIKAKELNFKLINNAKIRAHNNIYITYNNYLKYKKEKI